MSPNPTLSYNARTRPSADLFVAALSLCCTAEIDASGRCGGCEFMAAVEVPFTCSNCAAAVHTISDTEIECVGCGARWADLADGLESVLSHGMQASSWNPAKVPAHIVEQLSAFAGVTTVSSAHRIAAGTSIVDDWDGVE
jgi:hypothetical protein